jgi:histidyl-tRNA synthetase
LWWRVEELARRIFRRHGYGEIRTPIFEASGLFERAVGEETDIVGKEMYTFLDRGGRSLTLRPESTAPACRAYVEHRLDRGPQPVRWYYIGPQFRYERPQKGRFRQLHQIGAERLGAGGPDADVEILLLLVDFLEALGFQDLEVRLNTVGDTASRAAYRDALVAYLRPLADRLGPDSQRRLERNPLRILDTKSPEEQQLLAGAPVLSDFLTAESRKHFELVCSTLQSFGIRFRREPKLVRGLDYYTHTVFEVIAAGLGAQDALCGGGAYAGLVEELGGPPTYGVGFAIGQDRLMEVLPACSPVRRDEDRKLVLCRLPAHEADEAALLVAANRLARQLRQQNWTVVLYAGRPERALEVADRLGATGVLFLGESELEEEQVRVRRLSNRSQEVVSWKQLEEFFGSWNP